MNTSINAQPNFESDVKRLVQAFSYVRNLQSPLSRFVYLSRIAAYHGLSKSECRKAFEIFLNEFSEQEVGK